MNPPSQTVIITLAFAELFARPVIYIAFESRCFAIIGDSGINEVVPSDFWDSEKNLLAQYLRSGDATTGICLVIEAIGENLAKFFPPVDNDINEQPNETSYDEN